MVSTSLREFIALTEGDKRIRFGDLKPTPLHYRRKIVVRVRFGREEEDRQFAYAAAGIHDEDGDIASWPARSGVYTGGRRCANSVTLGQRASMTQKCPLSRFSCDLARTRQELNRVSTIHELAA